LHTDSYDDNRAHEILNKVYQRTGRPMVYTPIITKSPAVARIADRTGCQWPSRSSIYISFEIQYATSY